MQQTDLADMVVRAPFSGIAISKDAQPGEMISPVSAGGGFTRTGICTIVDMSSLEIEVDVNESYINRVHAGPAGRGDARRVSRLADPGPRHRDDPDRRSAEGNREGPHRIRSARSADPARHGRQGGVPPTTPEAAGAAAAAPRHAGAEGRRPHARRPFGRVRGQRRSRRAPGDYGWARRWRSDRSARRASAAGERVVVEGPPITDGRRQGRKER